MDNDILTVQEIKIIKDIWHKYYKFKIELEDLLQEARLLKIQKKDIQSGLEKYCRDWNRDVLSRAYPIQDKEYDINNENKNMPKREILQYLRQILTEKQFQIWYSIKIENCSIYQVSQEMGIKKSIIYKHLHNAEKRIKENQDEIIELLDYL